jgi:ABC-type amino acid transport substrate-binding protein
MVGEVVQEAARRWGIRLEWRLVKEGPQAALSSRKVDLWPLLSTQTDLWPNYHFTQPYLNISFVLVTADSRFISSKEGTAITRVASVRFPLVTKVVKQAFPNAEIVGFPSRQEAFAAVCDGRADIAVLESRALQRLALERPAACVKTNLFSRGVDVKRQELGLAWGIRAKAVAIPG